MKLLSQIAILIAGTLLSVISIWYGQHNGLLPVAASDEANQVDGIFNFMMTIATGLFLLIEGALIYMAFRFRRKPGDNTDGPPIEGNVPLEIVWTAIPAVIVFIISIYSFEVYNAMGGLDPMASHDSGPMPVSQQARASEQNLIAMNTNGKEIALGLGASPEYEGKEQPILVEVTGLQFAWVFSYPDSGVTSGELHIPVDREVQLNIHAQDVIHALWLPEFRLKQDAVPGRRTQLTFTPRRIGDYPVICAELCGPYHGAMNSRLYVQTPEDYENWIQSQLAQGNTLDKTVAVNSQDLTTEEFLKPFVAQMGMESLTHGEVQALHDHSMGEVAIK